MKYLFIFEDGGLQQGDKIPDEVLAMYDDGLYSIVDMETGMFYCGNDTWSVIEESK